MGIIGSRRSCLKRIHPFASRLWEFQWEPTKQHDTRTLMAKTTDKQGRSRPARHDPDPGAYTRLAMFYWC